MGSVDPRELKGLKPEIHLRERILVIGPAGSGKTSDLLSIISMAKRTRSDARAHILDSDGGAVARMLYTSTSRFKGLEDRITIYEVDQWPEWRDSINEAIEATRGRPQDWIAVDMITDAWESAQDYYTEQVHGVEAEDFFLEHRRKQLARKERSKKESGKKPKGESPANEQKDWDVIKRLYRSFFTKLYKRAQCNVFAAAQIRELRSDGMYQDDKETRRLMGSLGVTAKGEKSLSHRFDTVLLKRCDLEEQKWFLTTVKDREREYLEGAEVSPDFVRSYLLPVAKWRLR